MTDKEKHPNFDPYQYLGENLGSADAFNRWLLSRPRQRIVQLLKGQHVLDVACGTGNLTAMLVAAGCHAVGVDSSATMLSQARRKQIAAEFRHMDAARLPFNGDFDAAVISIALHETSLQVRELVWESMLRAVRLGGRLVVLDYTVPQRSTLLARIAGTLVEQDERSMLSIHPEHYRNFQEFMRKGGLHAWMQERSQPPQAEYHFWGGIVALVVTSR
jgi:ubiquinone/menaquinone biosynthesis C-methylase UbiE